MTTNFQSLKYEVVGGIAHIVLDRPALLNRFDLEAHEEFEAVLAQIHRDPAIRVVLISAQGRHFSAGGDLAEVARLREDSSLRRRMFHDARHLVQLLTTIDVPVIAAVQGEAVGLGATIAALCDIVVVAKTSGLTDPHVGIGLVAGDGGCVAWPLAMGLTRAKRYLLTGERVSGQLAYEFGLATDLVEENADVLPTAEKIAAKIAGLAPLAVKGTKRALISYTQRAMGDAFELAWAGEELTMTSKDAAEAVAALKEKRPPVYSGS